MSKQIFPGYVGVTGGGTGATGPQGDKGDKGDKGDTGAQGAPGSGGGGPSDVPHSIPGCYIWLSADNISGISDGSPVTSWVDPVSGLAGTVVGTPPTYRTNVVNGLPAVRFNADGKYAMMAPFDHAEWSIFVVLKWIAYAAYNCIVGIGGQNVDSSEWLFVNGTQRYIWYLLNSPTGYGSYAPTIGTFHQTNTVLRMDSAMGPIVYTRTEKANDISPASMDPPGVGTNCYLFTRCWLGSGRAGDPRAINADVAEFIIYKRGLSAAEVVTIENYLATKYGL